MKMETNEQEQIRYEIYHLAQKARQAQQFDAAKAVEHFREAYVMSTKLNDDKLERECALNLGAAYLAEGKCALNLGAAENSNKEAKEEAEKTAEKKAKDSLRYLHKATPENNNRQDLSDSYFGDLYFNKGMAHEMLGETEEALEMYDKGRDAYKNTRNAELEKQCFFAMGRIFCDMAIQQRLDPAKKEKAESYADKCRQIKLSGLPLESTGYIHVSQIYNEVGLLYTQLQCYDHALKCFEIAAEHCKQSRDTQRNQLLAVISQNQGAVYNFQGKYKESIKFHQEAEKLYRMIDSYRTARNGQGQCYINLAYSYFQLHLQEEDFLMDDAFHTFNDAKKAAEDTNDKNMLWQAYEGLGAVYFHRGQYPESVKQYREAIPLISDKDNSSRVADKLEGAIHHKLTQGQPGAVPRHLLRSSLSTMQFQPIQTQNMQSAAGGAEGPMTFRSAEVPMPLKEKPFERSVTVIPVVRRGQVRMRKKDSFGPHLPKVAQGFGAISHRSSTLTSREVAESPRQRSTSGLDTENMTEESSSEESESATDSSEDDEVETEDKKVGTESNVKETSSGTSPVRDKTQQDSSLREYENMLQLKEANEDESKDGSEDDSDENSEEDESTSDDYSSTDDAEEDGKTQKSKSSTQQGQNDASIRQSPRPTTSDIDPPYATIGTITRTGNDATPGSTGFHTVKYERNQRNGDDDDDNRMLRNLPRGQSEQILHEHHVKRRREEDIPPPLPDRKEKSKTCTVM